MDVHRPNELLVYYLQSPVFHFLHLQFIFSKASQRPCTETFYKNPPFKLKETDVMPSFKDKVSWCWLSRLRGAARSLQPALG